MENNLKSRLNDEKYKNWLKVSIALLHSKEALHDIAKDVIVKVHGEIKRKTGSSQCNGTCNTNKGKQPSCTSCSNWVKEIKSYNKGQLNWRNTEPKLWHEKAWEIAKCFMNAQGSKSTAQSNTGPEKTDLSGILNLLINCKEYKTYFKNAKLPERVREIRNKVMHSAKMTFTDDEAKDYFQDILALLEDEMTLKNSEVCKKNVSMLKSLRDGDLQIRPEQEVDCIDDILSVHERLLGSEEDPDLKRKSFEVLTTFIKKNNDLENKFQSKINMVTDKFQDITDSLDKRIESCEVEYGEMRGTIERLVNQLSQGKLNINDVKTSGSPENFVWKNSLQFYAQKNKLSLPEYIYEKTDSDKYISIVRVADKEFKSEQPRSTKKDAAQSAAKVALDYFRNCLETRKEEGVIAPSTQKPNPVLLGRKVCVNTNYKNLLQEYAQERAIPRPIYDTQKTEDGFVSSVLFDGALFSPLFPKARKIDAEQDAAQLAWTYFQQLPSVCESSGDTGSYDGSTSGNYDGSVDNSISARSTSKPFRSILNEYCQTSSEKPQFQIDHVLGGFSSTVTIHGHTCQSESPKATKKESEESAAMIACRMLGLLKIHENETYCERDKEVGDEVVRHQNKQDRLSPKPITNKVRHDLALPHSGDDITRESNRNDDQVTVIGATESTSSQNNEKGARPENVGMQTCQHVGLEKVVEPSNLHENTILSKNISHRMNVDENTNIAAVLESNSPQTIPVASNFKNNLAEYVKKYGENPRYVTTILEKEKQTFRSRVFLSYRCFKGEIAKRKKTAEQNAAMAALEEIKLSKSGSVSECRNILKEYHEKLIGINPKFPTYKAPSSPEEGKYNVIVVAVKKWTVSLSESRLANSDVRKALAQKAIDVLQEEGKYVQKSEEKSITSQFHEFCQKQKDVPKFVYTITGEQASYSGDLCFFTLEQYESLCPQPSKEQAITSAAVSACNDLGLIY